MHVRSSTHTSIHVHAHTAQLGGPRAPPPAARAARFPSPLPQLCARCSGRATSAGRRACQPATCVSPAVCAYVRHAAIQAARLQIGCSPVGW